MTSEPEGTLSDALVAVHDLLVDASVDHALCGGLAANLYREEVRASMEERPEGRQSSSGATRESSVCPQDRQNTKRTEARPSPSCSGTSRIR